MRVRSRFSDPCISGAESRCGSSKDPGMSIHSSTIWEKTVTSRRGAGEEVMIKFTASPAEASHVRMDGWKAGESFCKDLMEGRWFGWSRKAFMFRPWLRWRMNNRTEGGKFYTFVKRSTLLFQVSSGNFVRRKSSAPCELHGEVGRCRRGRGRGWQAAQEPEWQRAWEMPEGDRRIVKWWTELKESP